MDENGKVWPVLDTCTARKHNTLHARRKKGADKCWCPGALAAYRDYQASQSSGDPAQEALRRRLRPRPFTLKAPLVPFPDLSGGACVTPKGMEVAGAAFNDEFTAVGFTLRQAAKDMCETCPLLNTCKVMIKESEPAPGAFGGVYAGMDVWDRQGNPIRLVKGKVEEVFPRVAA